LVAAILRLSLLLVNGVDSIVFSGEANYARLGQNLVTGGGYHNMVGQPDLFKPPLFPLTVGVVYLLVGDLVLAGHLVAFTSGLLLLPATYFVARVLFDRRVGLVSALLVAVFPELIRASTVVRSEAMYVTLLFVSMYAGYRTAIDPSKTRHLLVGVLFGLCYLVRPQAVGFVVLGAIVTAGLIYRRNRERPVWKVAGRLASVGLQPLAFMVVASPYLYFLYRESGRFTFGTKTTKNIVQGEVRAGQSTTGLAHERLVNGLVEGTNVTRGQYLVEHGPSLVEYVTEAPLAIVRRYLLNLGELYYEVLPRLLPVSLFVLLGAALLVRERGLPRPDWRAYLYFSIVLYPLAVLPIFYVTTRFIVPLVPFVLLLVAVGTVTAVRVVHGKLSSVHDAVNRRRTWLVVGGIVALLVFPQVITYFPFFPGSYTASPEHKSAGEWLGANSASDAVVMERNSMVSFYAGRESQGLPYENFSRIMTYADNHSVDYLVFSERYAAPRRPHLRFLLNSSTPPSGLDPVYVRAEPQKIVIYRLT
jgi:4-amino-4-deoxy-L-arabinose transferase-like glycosyltransferase